MRNKKNRWILGSVLFFCVLLGCCVAFAAQAKKEVPPQAVAAAPSPVIKSGANQKDITFLETQDFAGIGLFSSYQTWITIPKSVVLDNDPKLVFYMGHSKTLGPLSTATVIFNDLPLQSTYLSPLNSDKTRYEVTVPRDLVKEQNSLEFRFYALSNQTDPCQDLENPANWVVIHRESTLDLSYGLKTVEFLNRWPEPYVGTGRDFQLPTALALPELPQREELETAGLVLQYLAGEEPYLYPNIRVSLGSNVPQVMQEDSNLISIGSFDRNPLSDLLKKRLPMEVLGKLNPSDGVIFLTESPVRAGRAVTLISGPKTGVLEKTAHVLAYPSYTRLLKTSYEIVDTSAIMFPKRRIPDLSRPTFRDLGYPSSKLSGTFESSSAFQYKRPPHWAILPGAYLRLEISFSPLLDPNTSMISIAINDKPVGAFKLTGRDGHQQYQIPIPQELLRESVLYATVTANLDVGKKDCTNRYYDQAWLVIHDNSYFHIPHELLTDRTFRTFPGPFYGKNGLEKMMCVIPDQPTVEELNTLYNVIYAISSATPADSEPHFEILQAAEATPRMLAEKHLILIGHPKRNPYVRDAGSKLALKLNEEGLPIKGQWKIPNRFLQDVGLLELSPSPWNSAKTLLLVSGEKDKLMEQASIDLMREDVAAEWKGNFVLVNQADEWFSNALPEIVRKPLVSTRAMFLYVWLGAALLLAVGVAFLIHWRYKHSLKNPLG